VRSLAQHQFVTGCEFKGSTQFENMVLGTCEENSCLDQNHRIFATVVFVDIQSV